MSTVEAMLPIAAPKQPAQAAPPRWVALDAMRLAAAYAIIWIHAVRSPALEASMALGRFAVPFFVFSAVFLTIEGLGRHPERTFSEYARQRFVRIYLPFLAWSGIYLIFKGVKWMLLPDLPNDLPGISILWAGSFYHLWFMPFILVVGLAAFGVGRAIEGRPRLALAVCTAMVALGFFLAVPPGISLAYRVDQYLHLVLTTMPAVCWALAFAVAYRHPTAKRLESRAATLLGLVVLATSTAWLWQYGYDSLAASLAGLGAMLVALAPGSNRWLLSAARLGPLAYGIYLSHLLFIKVLEAVAAKLGLGISWQLDICVFLASAVLSTLLAWWLSRWRPTRWLAV